MILRDPETGLPIPLPRSSVSAMPLAPGA